jgi:hypothetical protein
MKAQEMFEPHLVAPPSEAKILLSSGLRTIRPEQDEGGCRRYCAGPGVVRQNEQVGLFGNNGVESDGQETAPVG